MRYISLNTNRQFNMEPNNDISKERKKTMNKNTIETIKTLAGLVISVGVGTVVGNVLHMSTPKDATKLGRALAYVGGACIEGLVVAHAQLEAEEKIDAAVATFQEVVAEDGETEEEE